MRNFFIMFTSILCIVGIASVFSIANEAIYDSKGVIKDTNCTNNYKLVEMTEVLPCFYSCNCKPNPNGTVHCDLCPCKNQATTEIKTKVYLHACNCKPNPNGTIHCDICRSKQ